MTEQVKQFNMALGASFDCCICGKRHKTLMNDAARGCLGRLFNQILSFVRQDNYFVVLGLEGSWYQFFRSPDIGRNKFNIQFYPGHELFEYFGISDFEIALYGTPLTESCREAADKCLRPFDFNGSYKEEKLTQREKMIKEWRRYLPAMKLANLMRCDNIIDAFNKYKEMCEELLSDVIKDAKIPIRAIYDSMSNPESISVRLTKREFRIDNGRGDLRIYQNFGMEKCRIMYPGRIKGNGVMNANSVKFHYDKSDGSFYILSREIIECREFSALFRYRLGYRYLPNILSGDISIDDAIKDSKTFWSKKGVETCLRNLL